MSVRGQGSMSSQRPCAASKPAVHFHSAVILRFKACTEFEAKLFAKQNPRNAVSRGARAETDEVAVCSIPRDALDVAALPQGVDDRFASTRGSLRTPGAQRKTRQP